MSLMILRTGVFICLVLQAFSRGSTVLVSYYSLLSFISTSTEKDSITVLQAYNVDPGTNLPASWTSATN
jgi:hypothetical protein